MQQLPCRLKIEEICYYSRSDAEELEKERLDSVYRTTKLPDRCRKVFTLAYLEGKKSAEIAGDAKYLSTYGGGATL